MRNVPFTVMTAVFGDMTSRSLVTGHKLLPPTAEQKPFLPDDTVLIIAVVITKDLVFYSRIKSKCTGRNAN
jgi:hypothetical protein